jgi:phenylacetic acid degradation operon negative regulatory protein
MNKPSNTPVVAQLGIDPLGARSLILSALLGTHPPELSARSLVALAELFSIRAGTARTALSRMVANGELEGRDGRYRLTGRLLERQRQQDVGRSQPGGEWDGSWIVAVAVSDRRSVAERRAFRSSMVGSLLAELRPDIWMRPANVDGPAPSPDVLISRGPLDGGDVSELVGRLWPLEAIERQALRLRNALIERRSSLDRDDVEVLPETFLVSAAVVRFLRTEPQLPTALQPGVWTSPQLRPLYDDFERAFQRLLRRFFATVE